MAASSFHCPHCPTLYAQMHPACLVVVPSLMPLGNGSSCSGQLYGLLLLSQPRNCCRSCWLLLCWVHSGRGKHVCFHSDNEAVVAVVQRQYANDKLLHSLLCCLFFYAAIFNFYFLATHIPGAFNWVADAISRNHLSLVSSLLLQDSQVIVPPQIIRFLTVLPNWGSASWTELFVHSLTSASHHH